MLSKQGAQGSVPQRKSSYELSPLAWCLMMKYWMFPPKLGDWKGIVASKIRRKEEIKKKTETETKKKRKKRKEGGRERLQGEKERGKGRKEKRKYKGKVKLSLYAGDLTV